MWYEIIEITWLEMQTYFTARGMKPTGCWIGVIPSKHLQLWSQHWSHQKPSHSLVSTKFDNARKKKLWSSRRFVGGVPEIRSAKMLWFWRVDTGWILPELAGAALMPNDPQQKLAKKCVWSTEIRHAKTSRESVAPNPLWVPILCPMTSLQTLKKICRNPTFLFDDFPIGNHRLSMALS